MTKRRRERDRPKAGPDALYNPNKRVLLSYASEEEEQPDTASPLETDQDGPLYPNGRELAQYQFEDYDETGGEETDDHANDVTEQSTAKVEEKTEDQHLVTGSYKIRQKDDEYKNNGERKDRNSNQRPVLGLPSDDWDPDTDEYDGDTHAAMQYLETVRNERQQLPTIFSATSTSGVLIKNSPQDETEDGAEDGDVGCGYYEDGMYSVQPVVHLTVPEDTSSPQTVYTQALIARFLQQRQDLLEARGPNGQMIDCDGLLATASTRGPRAEAEWHQRVTTSTPLPAQISGLEMRTVFRAIEIIRQRCLGEATVINKFTSSWIWSLLARLDEVGNMTNDDVFPLRELGKRAILCRLAFTNPEVAVQLAAFREPAEAAQRDATLRTQSGSLTIREDSASTPTAAPVEPDDNTLATLDMILVIVGDVFRQRDLLEHRHMWTPCGELADAVSSETT